LSNSTKNSSTRKTTAVQKSKALAVVAFGSQEAEQAAGQILQPLAQLMVQHSVQLGSITEMLKKALVNAAIDNTQTSAKDMTDSSIAIITGVHRKDVRRLRQEPVSANSATTADPMMSVGAQVVARWISEPTYLTAHNKARPLPRTPRHAQPGEPDFTGLVAQVSNDVGAKAVLDELVRLGIASIGADNLVQLRQDAFVPQDGASEQFHFLAANVSDHLATAVQNLRPNRKQDAMLEQSAFAKNLSADDAAQLEQTARHLWAQALKVFLQKATVAEHSSSKKKQATQRVRFGVYFHQVSASTTPVPSEAQLQKPKLPRNTLRKKAQP
jgi:hypothetical protein